jgi:hypothetical protein
MSAAPPAKQRSFWDQFMTQANDSNYNYNFEQLEKRKEVADGRLKKALWGAAEARRPCSAPVPQAGMRAVRMSDDGFFNEHNLALEHRGGVSVYAYRVERK